MPWYEYSTPTDATPRPIVVVRLWHGNRHVRLIALVDSGADSSLFAASYADFLGLDRTAAEVTVNSGADGGAFSVLSWPHLPLEIRLEQHRFSFRGSFIDFPTGADAMNLLS